MSKVSGQFSGEAGEITVPTPSRNLGSGCVACIQAMLFSDSTFLGIDLLEPCGTGPCPRRSAAAKPTKLRSAPDAARGPPCNTTHFREEVIFATAWPAIFRNASRISLLPPTVRYRSYSKTVSGTIANLTTGAK